MNKDNRKQRQAVGLRIAALLVTAGLVLNTGASVQADATPVRQVTGAAASVMFNDISSHWAKASIEQAVKKGYVNGYADGTFQPNRQISRAEFTKMLVSALGLEVVPQEGGKWYDAYFTAASQAEITSAAEFNHNVDKPLTRLEMSRLAMKALGEKLIGYEPERFEIGHTFDEFKAYGDDHFNQKKFMFYAAQKGIIGGVAPGVIAPNNTTTRAESITVIERIFSVKNGGKLKVDKYAVQAAELYWHKTNVFSVMPEFFIAKDATVSYDPTKLIVESADKNYKAEIDSIVAIDLADPNDPNLKLVPKVEDLRWNANPREAGMPLDKYLDSYLIHIEGHVVKAQGPYARYAGSKHVQTYFDSPFKKNISEFWSGKLNNLAWVFAKGETVGDRSLFIFPKKGLIVEKGSLSLYLEVPGIGAIQHVPVLIGGPNFK